MPLLLTARCRDASLRRLMLRAGQEARVGRSESVEMSLAGDVNLADEHFLVCCDRRVSVEVIDPQQALFIDGSPKNRLELSDGSEEMVEFVAGSTTFTVRHSPELSPAESTERGGHDPVADENPVEDQSGLIAEIVEKMSLSKEAAALRLSPDRNVSFLDRLIDAGLENDALLFLALALPPADSVSWVFHSEHVIKADACDLSAKITRWLGTQSEADRIQVRNQLSVGTPDKSLRWLAEAVVFSGGSLAPDGQPIIAPPTHLPAVAVVTAIRWAIAKQADQNVALAAWVQSGRDAYEQLQPQTKESVDAPGSSSL